MDNVSIKDIVYERIDADTLKVVTSFEDHIEVHNRKDIESRIANHKQTKISIDSEISLLISRIAILNE